jgi:uncharacterized membrane protein YgaE (UPF0421/DUF939 family)
MKEKNETKIKKEKDEMSCLASSLKDEKQELEFHKNHSSNNQLFVVLRKQITNIEVTAMFVKLYPSPRFRFT